MENKRTEEHRNTPTACSEFDFNQPDRSPRRLPISCSRENLEMKTLTVILQKGGMSGPAPHILVDDVWPAD